MASCQLLLNGNQSLPGKARDVLAIDFDVRDLACFATTGQDAKSVKCLDLLLVIGNASIHTKYYSVHATK